MVRQLKKRTPKFRLLALLALVLLVRVYYSSIPAHSKPLPVAHPETVLSTDVFVLPSKNIYCSVNNAEGFQGLRCDLQSPLKPTPKGTCELDWTGVSLPNTGQVKAMCAGDTVAQCASRSLTDARRSPASCPTARGWICSRSAR